MDLENRGYEFKLEIYMCIYIYLRKNILTSSELYENYTYFPFSMETYINLPHNYKMAIHKFILNF